MWYLVAMSLRDEDSKRIRCSKCRLTQFVTPRRACRRCDHSFIPFQFQQQDVPVLNGPVGPGVLGARLWRGWTQKRLGFEACLPRTYINRIENGRLQPGQGVVSKIAEALGVEVRTLYQTQGIGKTGFEEAA